MQTAVEELEVEKMVGVVATTKVIPTLMAVKEEETAKEVLATLRSLVISCFLSGGTEQCVESYTCL